MTDRLTDRMSDGMTDRLTDRVSDWSTEQVMGLKDFRPVTEEDIPLLRQYFERFPSRSCDFTIGGVLMWTDYFNYRFAVADGSLLITGVDPESGCRLFYIPCGPLDIGQYCSMVADKCLNNKIPTIMISPRERLVDAPEDSESGHYETLPDWMEYLYEAERFVTFAGRKMEKKRNHLHFFINNYRPFTVEPISRLNIPELISFTLAFNAMHEESELADYECRQVIKVLRKFGMYPFFGIAVRKDGHIIGYSFGETVGDTFFAHVEKGDTAYRGIYQYLASEMAREALERNPEIRYLNREEDMGDESLRMSKESYHPALYIDKLHINL